MRVTTNAVVGWLLMASWVYYVDNSRVSLLSDTQFDKACSWLLRHYEQVTHRLKYLVHREVLISGSLHHLRHDDYPQQLVRLALAARENLEK